MVVFVFVFVFVVVFVDGDDLPPPHPQRSSRLSRHANDDRVRRHVAHDHGVRTAHRSVFDPNLPEDRRPTADVDASANHRLRERLGFLCDAERAEGAAHGGVVAGAGREPLIARGLVMLGRNSELVP